MEAGWCWANLALNNGYGMLASPISLQLDVFNLVSFGPSKKIYACRVICASCLLEHVILQSESCKGFVFLDLLAMASH